MLDDEVMEPEGRPVAGGVAGRRNFVVECGAVAFAADFARGEHGARCPMCKASGKYDFVCVRYQRMKSAGFK